MPFHQALVRVSGPTDKATVLAAAAEVGLSVERLKTDMEEPTIQTAIDRHLALARPLGISGTPTFVVGNQSLPGATDLKTLQGVICEVRDTS